MWWCHGILMSRCDDVTEFWCHDVMMFCCDPAVTCQPAGCVVMSAWTSETVGEKEVWWCQQKTTFVWHKQLMWWCQWKLLWCQRIVCLCHLHVSLCFESERNLLCLTFTSTLNLKSKMPGFPGCGKPIQLQQNASLSLANCCIPSWMRNA